jgi:serine protease Do/2-alkenal reductase
MKAVIKILCALGLMLNCGPVRAADMPPELADLAAKVLPAVVSIASTDPVTDSSAGDNDDNDDNDNNDDGGGDDGSAYHPQKTADTQNDPGTVLPPPKADEALGSGFVFDPSGYILTNAHVINGAASITVTFQDGTILPATVVGRDKDGDLAVLKVNAGHKLAAVSFGDSGKLRVGDWVLAVGNPFGLPGSTSAGIVSALDRNINENAYDDFIQTDATINRGNSGGPLFDLAGQVIGVNSAIYSPDGGSVGIGFAIPSAMAAPVAAALIKNGVMQRGWLGVSTQEVTPEIAQLLSLPNTQGALVGGISPKSPADGKLQPGDNLVALAGVPINDPRGLMIRTAEIPAGETVKVRFWRNGSLDHTTLTVAAPPAALDDTEAAPPAAAPSNVTIAGIGLAVAPATTDTGLQVMSVTPKSPAAKAGIVADDNVEQIGGAAVGSPADLQSAVKTLAAAHQPAILLISGDTADGSDPGPRWVAVPVK